MNNHIIQLGGGKTTTLLEVQKEIFDLLKSRIVPGGSRYVSRLEKVKELCALSFKYQDIEVALRAIMAIESLVTEIMLADDKLIEDMKRGPWL